MSSDGWLHTNRVAVGGFLVFFLVLTTLILLKLPQNWYLDKQAGYRINGPVGWTKEVGEREVSVTFRKYRQKGRYGNAFIRMETELGNPYGNSIWDYLINGILPRLRKTYADRLTVERPPRLIRVNGREWATASFLLDLDQLLEFSVTRVGDRTFTLSFYARGYRREEDERLYRKTRQSIQFHLRSYDGTFFDISGKR